MTDGATRPRSFPNRLAFLGVPRALYDQLNGFGGKVAVRTGDYSAG